MARPKSKSAQTWLNKRFTAPNTGLEPTRYARGTRIAPGLVVVLAFVAALARPARGSTRCR